MASSKQLRNNANQHQPKNEHSKSQDKIVRDATRRIKAVLEIDYPHLCFGVDTLIPYPDETNYRQVNSRRGIKPDGSALWVEIQGKKLYLLVTEQKKQGTNDENYIEGKDLSPTKGNVVGRFGQSLRFYDNLFIDGDVYPLVIFLQGCDFYEESPGENYICERVVNMFHQIPMNQINLKPIQISERLWAGGSYFMRGHHHTEPPGTSDWKEEEVYPIMKTIALGALESYIKSHDGE